MSNLLNTPMFEPLSLLISCAIVLGSATSAAAPDESSTTPYKIGVLAYKGKPAAIKRWGAHGDYLNHVLAPLRFQIVPLTYKQDELSQAVINHTVDFVITNPGHYTELELGGHVSRMATRRMSGPQGMLDQFGGTAVTLPDRNDLDSYKDLTGKTILIPSRSSLGGWQVHLREGIAQGVDLRTDAKILELKNHKKVIEAILAGQADAGFVRADLIEEMVEDGVLRFDQLKIVNKRVEPGYPYLLSTRLYPEWPFAQVTGTSPELSVKVLQALLAIRPDDVVARKARIHGWTIPGHYSSVGDLFRESSLGPYAQQPLTLHKVFEKYRLEVLFITSIFILLLLLSILRTKRANYALRREVRERKAAEQRISHQAYFDALTNLPNRRHALDRLSQLIRDAKRNDDLVAVLFLDLDDFKKVNDTLGHEIGDKLLIEAADRLRSGIRSGDTVWRLGGDEFIVLLGGLTDEVDARPVVENLLQRFRAPFQLGSRELIITTSVGISVCPHDGDSPSELLRSADSAMYHSKEQGRNTYSFFTEAMNRKISRRLAVEEQMHGVLDRGEFRLCYQPKIDVSNGEIVGVEALLRWSNPVLGEVSPVEFIPLAEQTGMIIAIGEFVIREAFRQGAFWRRDHGSVFTISVNLSPIQFRNSQLVGIIENALSESGLPGNSVEIEITEGVLMLGHTYIAQALEALNQLGIVISMDDFGTGYSSMSYLRQYPFDVLKIDREFVKDIIVDPDDRELINATIAMAHGLGLKVVAEGVETGEQLAYLASHGCEYAQGYLFSKPVKPDKISRMLEKLWSTINQGSVT